MAAEKTTIASKHLVLGPGWSPGELMKAVCYDSVSLAPDVSTVASQDFSS